MREFEVMRLEGGNHSRDKLIFVYSEVSFIYTISVDIDLFQVDDSEMDAYVYFKKPQNEVLRKAIPLIA